MKKNMIYLGMFLATSMVAMEQQENVSVIKNLSEEYFISRFYGCVYEGNKLYIQCNAGLKSSITIPITELLVIDLSTNASERYVIPKHGMIGICNGNPVLTDYSSFISVVEKAPLEKYLAHINDADRTPGGYNFKIIYSLINPLDFSDSFDMKSLKGMHWMRSLNHFIVLVGLDGHICIYDTIFDTKRFIKLTEPIKHATIGFSQKQEIFIAVHHHDTVRDQDVVCIYGAQSAEPLSSIQFAHSIIDITSNPRGEYITILGTDNTVHVVAIDLVYKKNSQELAMRTKKVDLPFESTFCKSYKDDFVILQDAGEGQLCILGLTEMNAIANYVLTGFNEFLQPSRAFVHPSKAVIISLQRNILTDHRYWLHMPVDPNNPRSTYIAVGEELTHYNFDESQCEEAFRQSLIKNHKQLLQERFLSRALRERNRQQVTPEPLVDDPAERSSAAVKRRRVAPDENQV